VCGPPSFFPSYQLPPPSPPSHPTLLFVPLEWLPVFHMCGGGVRVVLQSLMSQCLFVCCAVCFRDPLLGGSGPPLQDSVAPRWRVCVLRLRRPCMWCESGRRGPNPCALLCLVSLASPAPHPPNPFPHLLSISPLVSCTHVRFCLRVCVSVCANVLACVQAWHRWYRRWVRHRRFGHIRVHPPAGQQWRQRGRRRCCGPGPKSGGDAQRGRSRCHGRCLCSSGGGGT
jgi:hypothetical protein